MVDRSSNTKGRDDPAFPTQKISRNSFGDIDERTTVPGLTKREYFAAMVMQGMCSTDWSAGRLYDFDAMASDAVGAADSLLKELAK